MRHMTFPERHAHSVSPHQCIPPQLPCTHPQTRDLLYGRAPAQPVIQLHQHTSVPHAVGVPGEHLTIAWSDTCAECLLEHLFDLLFSH